jgi:uncharacterized protein YhaN
MFQDDIFDEWLESESKTVLQKFKTNKPLTVEDKMILTLKAQTNHFHHLDQDIRRDIAAFKVDVDKRFEQMEKQFDKKFEQVDKRFQQVDKRFEQVDKRFEQVDKRFDAVILRMDRFMLWSLGLTMTSTFAIVGFMYKLIK